MGQQNIDIFAKVAQPKWFKFENVGDGVQGTYVGRFEAEDSYGNAQIVYELKTSSGEVFRIGIRETIKPVHDEMDKARFGQIIGFKFDEKRPSKKFPNDPSKMSKIIKVYADEKYIDHEWIKEQEIIQQSLGALENVQEVVEKSPSSKEVKAEFGNKDLDEIPFGDNEVAKQAAEKEAKTGDLNSLKKEIEASAVQTDSAISAIKSLAVTKGIVSAESSDEDLSSKIKEKTGLDLTEENYTKVIIELTKI